MLSVKGLGSLSAFSPADRPDKATVLRTFSIGPGKEDPINFQRAILAYMPRGKTRPQSLA